MLKVPKSRGCRIYPVLLVLCYLEVRANQELGAEAALRDSQSASGS